MIERSRRGPCRRNQTKKKESQCLYLMLWRRTHFFFPLFVSKKQLCCSLIDQKKKEDFCQVEAKWITATLTSLALSYYCNVFLYTRLMCFLFCLQFFSIIFPPFFQCKTITKKDVTNEQIECESIRFHLTEQLKSRKAKSNRCIRSKKKAKRSSGFPIIKWKVFPFFYSFRVK